MDVYTVGVNIAFASNAATMLGMMDRHLLGLQHGAKGLTNQFNAMRVAAVGALGVMAGGAALAGMWKLVDAGKELVNQQALYRASLRESGLTAGQIAERTAEMTAAAWKNARDVAGTTAAESLKSLRELRMVFGDEHHAIDNLEIVSRAQVVMDVMRNKHGLGNDQVFEMAKALEIKGVASDPKHFAYLLDWMVKAAVASGGRVTGEDFHGTFKYGRSATLGWNDAFVGQVLPTLIQEFKTKGGTGGAGGPGNALQSAYQAIVGGTITNKAAEQFNKLGMLNPKAVIRTKTGSIKGIRPGGIAGSDLFQADPYEWVQQVLMPAMKAKGITKEEDVRKTIAHLFTNRTAQQVVMMFALQGRFMHGDESRFEKDRKLLSDAGGLSAYEQLMKESPEAKIKAFHDAWTNLLTALGAPLVDDATNMLSKLTGILTDLSQWAARNQEMVGSIEKIGIVLATLAVGVGTLAVGTAAFAALGALGGATGMIAGIGAGALLATDGLSKLEKKLQNLFPFLFTEEQKAGKGPFGDKPLTLPPWLPFRPKDALLPDGTLPAPSPPRKLEDIPLENRPAFRLHRPGVPNAVPPPKPEPERQSWLDQPMRVVVVNGRDLVAGVTAEQGRQLSRQVPGSTGYDARLSIPFASAVG